MARSPSPSNATPIRWPPWRTKAASFSGCVEPQSRLMFRPFGSFPTSETSKPRSRNSRRATGVDAAAQLTFDPFARFARVAADDEAQRPRSGRRVRSQRADERGPEPGHRFVIERIFARGAADAVGAEESMHLSDNDRDQR